jgi:hypothetical protein
MARKPGGKNNSFKHGTFAGNFVTLPDENRDEFELLHQDLVEEWKPTGALEEDTVLTLAQCVWLKRRVEEFYHREATGSKDKDEIRFVIYVVNYILDNAETFEEATNLTRLLPAEYRDWVAKEAPRSNFKDDKTWIQTLTSKIRYFAKGHQLYANAAEGLTSKATYLRELTAKKITLDERLDARIDKALKRLAQLKTFKQVLEDQASRAKTIDHRISD